MKIQVVLVSSLLLISSAAHAQMVSRPFRLRCRPFKVHESYIKFEQETGSHLREIILHQPKDEPAILTLAEQDAFGGVGKEREFPSVQYEGKSSEGFRASWGPSKLMVTLTGTRKQGQVQVAEYTGSLTMRPGQGFFVSCELFDS